LIDDDIAKLGLFGSSPPLKFLTAAGLPRASVEMACWHHLPLL